MQKMPSFDLILAFKPIFRNTFTVFRPISAAELIIRLTFGVLTRTAAKGQSSLAFIFILFYLE